MKKFKFEIQALKTIVIEGETAEEARDKLLEIILDIESEIYQDPNLYDDCYVSDGEEVWERLSSEEKPQKMSGFMEV